MTLVGAAQVLGLIAGSLTALGVIVRLRPVKWVWRRLVADPMNDWFVHRVRAVVSTELDRRPVTNGIGWKTLKAMAEKMGIDPHEL